MTCLQLVKARKQFVFNQIPILYSHKFLDYNPLADSKIRFKYVDIAEFEVDVEEIIYEYFACNISITATDPATEFVLDVHKNGVYQYTSDVFTGDVNFPLASNYPNDEAGMDDYYEVYLRTNDADTFFIYISWHAFLFMG